MHEITTSNAPESLGPYSQGIETETLVFVSGQGARSPETNDIVSDDVREQTEQVMENVSAVLTAADSSLGQIVKATVFLTDMDDYEAVNEVYGRYVGEPAPARSAVAVSELPTDICVEIEVIAEKGSE